MYGNQCKAQPNGTEGILKDLVSKSEFDLFNKLVTEVGQVDIDASDPQGVADQMTVQLSVYGTGSGSLSDTDKQELMNALQTLIQKLYS